MLNSILNDTIQLKNKKYILTFKSVGITRLAIFLWMKMSPGSVSVNSLGGALESEQPINKYFGFCPFASFLK